MVTAEPSHSLVDRHRLLEEALRECLPQSPHVGAGRLNQAVSDAVFPGGRRWRPALTLLAGEVVAAPARRLLPVACAVEYVHTASLIFDDLPCMDDASVRRGRAALHCTYGESTALLAALALLNRSYELFSGAGDDASGSAVLVAAAARAIGIDGMVAGQAADLYAVAADALLTRQCKTTQLVRLAATAGALAVGSSARDIAALGRFGDCLGAAYQIDDDLLDATADEADTGKPMRQDARHARQTWPVHHSAAEVKATSARLMRDAEGALLDHFGRQAAVQTLLRFAHATLKHPDARPDVAAIESMR